MSASTLVPCVKSMCGWWGVKGIDQFHNEPKSKYTRVLMLYQMHCGLSDLPRSPQRPLELVGINLQAIALLLVHVLGIGVVFRYGHRHILRQVCVHAYQITARAVR